MESHDVSVAGVISKEGWHAIELALPVVFEGKQDHLYAPVFARIENGMLLEWTTTIPECFKAAPDTRHQESLESLS